MSNGLRSNEPLSADELREQFEEYAQMKNVDPDSLELCWMFYRAGWKMREYNDSLATDDAPRGSGN